MTEKELYKIRDLKVRKTNDLIQKSHFSLSLQEQKMMLYIISKVKRGEDAPEEITISLSEFCAVSGIAVCGSNYKILKDALQALRDKSMWFDTDTGKSKLVSWIEKPELDTRNGTVTVRLDPDLKPYLMQYRGSYTQYELVWAMHFSSKYTIRLYEYITSMNYSTKDAFTWTVSVEDLRERMGAANYSSWNDFKKRALIPAIDEINSFSDQNLSYGFNRKSAGKGNAVASVTLTSQPKETLARLALRAAVEDEMNAKIGLDGTANMDELAAMFSGSEQTAALPPSADAHSFTGESVVGYTAPESEPPRSEPEAPKRKPRTKAATKTATKKKTESDDKHSLPDTIRVKKE